MDADIANLKQKLGDVWIPFCTGHPTDTHHIATVQQLVHVSSQETHVYISIRTRPWLDAFNKKFLPSLLGEIDNIGSAVFYPEVSLKKERRGCLYRNTAEEHRKHLRGKKLSLFFIVDIETVHLQDVPFLRNAIQQARDHVNKEWRAFNDDDVRSDALECVQRVWLLDRKSGALRSMVINVFTSLFESLKGKVFLLGHPSFDDLWKQMHTQSVSQMLQMARDDAASSGTFSDASSRSDRMAHLSGETTVGKGAMVETNQPETSRVFLSKTLVRTKQITD